MHPRNLALLVPALALLLPSAERPRSRTLPPGALRSTVEAEAPRGVMAPLPGPGVASFVAVPPAGLLARLAPPHAAPRGRVELLRRLEAGLGPLVAVPDARGELGGIELLAPPSLERLLAALDAELGWKAIGPDDPAPRGAALRVAAPRELDRDTALVMAEPLVDGAPLADGGLVVELSHDPAGWVAMGVLGRLLAAPIPDGAWTAAGEAAVRPDHELRRVLEPVDGGWRRAIEARGLGADGVPRREAFDGATGRLLATRDLRCAGTSLARVVAKDPETTPAAEERPLAGLTVRQGVLSAVTDALGQHPFAGSVEVPALSGPGLRVFRTRWVPGGFAGRIEWDPAGDLRWSGPADFTLAAPDGDAQGDAVHAFWSVNEYREHLRRAFPILAVWNRRQGLPAALERRFALWPDVNGPIGYYQAWPVTIDGEEFPGLLQLGSAGPADLGRPARIAFARVAHLVRHEYTHAVLQEVADIYGSAVDEGLADYFPCAELEDPHWCRTLEARYYRDLSGATGRLVWPRDAEPSFEIHRVGNILGQGLWRARTAIEARQPGGRLRFDRTVVAALVRCPPRPDLFQLRSALVAADADLNLGGLRGEIEQALFEHGIGPAPVPGGAVTPRGLDVLHAASYAPRVAPGSLAAAFGGRDPALRVELLDAAGATHAVAVIAAAPGQVNFLVPAAAATGPATVTAEDALGVIARGSVEVAPVAPGLFTADASGRGRAAGSWILERGDGTRSEGTLDGPIEGGAPGDRMWLVLWGTGISRGARVECRVGGQAAQVAHVGEHAAHPGLDQVNVWLPGGLLAGGTAVVELVVDGRAAAPVEVAAR